MNVSTSQASWYGQKALQLENQTIRTVVVPGMGAKLVSLLDKRTNREWIVAPGERPLRTAAYGAEFTAQDMSGWDEMFPTVLACKYPAPGENYGTSLPDHGEIWPLPWKSEPASPDSIRLSIEGKALPYRLTRTLSYSDKDTLLMEYRLENLGREIMPYLWAAHPQFVCSNGAEILLPRTVKEVCNTLPAEWGWGKPEARHDWPETIRPDGQRASINHTGPADLKQIRKFFVPPENSASWAGLIRQPGREWLRLAWDPNMVPYLGIWIDEGGISHDSVVAIEPMTGFYDSLFVAWQKKRVSTIEPGATHSWSLSVRLGTGSQSFPDVESLIGD